MIALFGKRCNFGCFPDPWECWRWKRSIVDWCNKREYNWQAVFNDSSWHFINPRSLIRRHCIYNVLDMFIFNRMKCKLLRCRKTSRSKDAVIQVEVVLFSQRFYFGIGWFSNWRKKNIESIRHDLVLFAVNFRGDWSFRDAEPDCLPNIICVPWVVLDLIFNEFTLCCSDWLSDLVFQVFIGRLGMWMGAQDISNWKASGL